MQPSRSRLCFGSLLLAFLAVVWFGLAPRLMAQTPNPNEAKSSTAGKAPPVSFIKDIAPIFKESCFGCHGPKSPKGKLDMTKFATLRKGGTKDDPIVEGKPDDSYLIDVLIATDRQRMPPLETGDPLPKEKIELIKRWIAEGAKLDADVKPEDDLVRELRKRYVPPAPPVVYPYPVTVTALAFTPDNKKLVVSGHHELNVYEVASGRLEKRISTRSRRAMAMTFLADGKLVVAGGRPGEEGDVRVYNLDAPGKKVGDLTFLDGVNDKNVLLAHLGDSDDEILGLAVSADGKKVAAGGCDRIVQIWDISAGVDKAKSIASIENHADWVFGVAFSPDGKLLYTASRDKTAKVWDLNAKESLITFPDHQNTVYDVLPAQAGKAGLSVGEDNQLRLWNVTGDKAGKSLRNAGHGRPVFRLAAVPGKPIVVTCSADATLKSWDAEKLTPGKTMGGFSDHVYAVAISPDGTLVAGGAFNGEVRIFQLTDGSLVKNFNASPGYSDKK